ncbi:MAG: hypothetical protein D6780_05370, partial [Candidatus Dadabacteria bacterium]
LEEITIDLLRLCRAAGAVFVKGKVIGLNTSEQKIFLEAKAPLYYDLLSLNIGSIPDSSIKGAKEYAVALKPIYPFIKKWRGFLSLSAEGRVVIVGAGAGGVELGLSIKGRQRKASVTVVGIELLPSHNKMAKSLAFKACSDRGVKLITGEKVLEIKKNEVVLENGKVIPSDFTILATSAEPHFFLKNSGISLDKKGFVSVKKSLQSVSHPNVFAVGDCASFEEKGVSKAGVYAVREAPVLFKNIESYLRDGKIAGFKEYKPQRSFLALIGCGDNTAIAVRDFWALRGKFFWGLKKWIDKRFMSKFLSAIEMKALMMKPSADLMKCTACGGKTGAKVLYSSLAELKGIKVKADDAVFLEEGSLFIQSVDGFFAPDISPYLLGKIIALHGFNDIIAKG